MYSDSCLGGLNSTIHPQRHNTIDQTMRVVGAKAEGGGGYHVGAASAAALTPAASEERKFCGSAL